MGFFFRRGKERERENSREDVNIILEQALDYLKSNPEVVFIPYPDYEECVMQVLGTLEDDRYLSNYEKIRDKNIESMTIKEIATMYTFILRGERFCDGHIASYIENGTLYMLVKRHLELLESK